MGKILTVTELEKMLDPCAAKHGGVSTSREANRKNLHGRNEQRKTVYEIIRRSPATMKEVAAEMGVQLNRISGRASELAYGGYVVDTGERRGGARVLKVTGREF